MFVKTAYLQFLLGIIYINNARFSDALREFEKAAGQKDCKTAGVNSYAAWYNIGVICECLGEKQRAVKYYKKCGDYQPALERLHEIV